jgi:hypothetical protein
VQITAEIRSVRYSPGRYRHVPACQGGGMQPGYLKGERDDA